MKVNIKNPKISTSFKTERVYPELEDLEITPTAEEQNFKSSKYGFDNVTVKGYSGIDTSDATATAGDLLKDKTAYANGEKITGTIEEYDGSFEGSVIEIEENAIIDVSSITTNTSTTDDKILMKMIKRIPNIDTSQWLSCSYLFAGCHNLEEIPEINTSNVTTMNYMFSECNLITEIPEIDTSQVTSFLYMFNNCKKLKKIPILDMSKGTNINNMFFGCTELQEIPEELIFPSAKGLNYLFGYCYKLTNVPAINTSNAINISNVFYCCESLTNFGGFLELGKAYIQKTQNYSQYKLSFKLGSSAMPLTYGSLMNVINNLYDLNLTYDVANGGTLYTQQLVLGSTNLAKLTAEEIAIATNKGWTVS